MLRGASFYSLGRLGPRAEALLKPEPNPYSRKLQVLEVSHRGMLNPTDCS